MLQHFDIVKRILVLSTLVLTLLSCQKGVVLINGWDNDDINESGSNNQTDKDKVQMNFNATLFNQFTRSLADTTSAIDTERLATIYAYTVGKNSTLFAAVNYKSESVGALSPVTSPMYLAPNTYSLYAVGVNDANAVVPTFTNGIANNLQNGMDYIWDGIWNVDPIGTQDTITITFKHCCTQMLVDLVVQDDITINSVTSVTISPPDTTSVEWSLFDSGAISPATSINTHNADRVYMGFKKTAFGFRSAYVMLPITVAEKTDILCEFVLTIDNESSNRTYQLEIPVYENAMKAGVAYLYNVTLQRDTLLFDGVDMTDWNVIDVNGNPIIPIQVD